MTYPRSPNPLGMPHWDDLLDDAGKLLETDSNERDGRITHAEAENQRTQVIQHARETWAAMHTEVRLERENDGRLVGDDHGHYCVYDPDACIRDVHPVTPAPGSPGANAPIDATVFYVNGIWHDVPMQYKEMQELADRSGARVIGIHNGAGPWQWVSDGTQALVDKLAWLPFVDYIHNRAADTVAHLVQAAALCDQPINIFGHSHGGLIISRGLRQFEHSWKEIFGEDPRRALSLVWVQTFGGAAQTYPAGPHYLHVMNQDDRVVRQHGYGHFGGVGLIGAERRFDRSDVHFDLFHDSRNISGHDPDHHDFADIYLPRLNTSMIVQASFPPRVEPFAEDYGLYIEEQDNELDDSQDDLSGLTGDGERDIQIPAAVIAPQTAPGPRERGDQYAHHDRDHDDEYEDETSETEDTDPRDYDQDEGEDDGYEQDEDDEQYEDEEDEDQEDEYDDQEQDEDDEDDEQYDDEQYLDEEDDDEEDDEQYLDEEDEDLDDHEDAEYGCDRDDYGYSSANDEYDNDDSGASADDDDDD